MCQGCYDEAGRPTEWNDTIAWAVDLIQTIYRHHAAGGLLHVVLDDWNIDDDIVEWCDGHVDEKAQEWGDEPEMVAACRELAPLLKTMTKGERASALAYAHGFVSPPVGAPEA